MTTPTDGDHVMAMETEMAAESNAHGTSSGNKTPAWSACVSLEAHALPISRLQFSHDGQFLATASADRTVKVWATSALLQLQQHDHHHHHASSLLKPLMTLRGHDQGVSDVAWSRDDALLVSASDDRTLRLWNVKQRACVSVLGTPSHHASVLFTGLPPTADTATILDSINGTAISGASSSSAVGAGGSSQSHSHGQGGPIHSHSSSASGTSISMSSALVHGGTLASSANGLGTNSSSTSSSSTRVGGVALHALSEPDRGHASYVFCCAFNPQATLLASASYDESVRLWDLRTGKCVHHQMAHQEAVTSVCFQPVDGSLLATGSLDGLVRLWDVATMQCLREVVGHVRVASVQFTPNAQYLLVATLNGTLSLWAYQCAQGPRRVRCFRGHVNRQFCLASSFLPSSHGETTKTKKKKEDGKGEDGTGATAAGYILSGSEDGRVVVWDVDTQRVVDEWAWPQKNEATSTRTSVSELNTKTKTRAVLALSVHPAQPLVASASQNTLTLWQPTAGG